MSSGFPWYFVINDRPVKVVATPDGGMDVLILNLETGKLERNLSYLSRCFEPGQDVNRLSEAEFNQRVETIRHSLNDQTASG
ncbi:hypothetical protein J5X98_18525 [Leptothermofonsia sichuanensis E412]|jgi:hypothetical protein|uniref:hypothetical protein n=1 Tax=Leptothermofonsia sichuanensis TaxID=2917832 RepID=UPI001CA68490|nr:hypothetical protein [Leptothermofonsia sichuanensis]QZZ19366.1 hypothetical protein J5X98_18525 [Leptothermofonsia sichuanensis E412]